MIITNEGRLYVAVGVVVTYKGNDYVCLAAPVGNKLGGCQNCALCKVKPCKIIECRGSYRYDGEGVYFKLLGKKEGGVE